MYVHLYRHWVAFSNICVTTVNMRKVFYYNISQYSHFPQKVTVTFDSLYLSGVGS